MQFVNPLFLYGLFALAIPIAIHLFNFRRYRKVYFSNVELLRNFQKKTRKRSELLHYLVLAARILTITALVLAFAQPYIPSGEKLITGGVNVAGIFVDNSFSMEAGSNDGRKLDEAKKKAAAIAEAYDADDLFQLLTNDFEGRHQRLVPRDEFLLMLREVKPGPMYRSLAEISSRQAALLLDKRYPSSSAFVLSDFQKSTVLSVLPDSTSGFTSFMVPMLSGTSGNLYIDSCWFENPVLRINQTAGLNVRISNMSEDNLEKIPVKLTINGEQRAVAAFDIEPWGSLTTTLNFSTTSTGTQKAVVEITDYPVIFDDNYYLVFEVSESLPVLVVNPGDENAYLNSVFSLDSVVKLSNSPLRQTNFAEISNQHLIILNGIDNLSSGAIAELETYVVQGGSLLVFPPEKAGVESVNQLLNSLEAPSYGVVDTAVSRVSTMNKNHPLFQNVFDNVADKGNPDLPFVKKHFELLNPLNGMADPLMTLDNGNPFFTMKYYGRGKVYISAVSPEDGWSNWPRHALFVPVMLNIAFQAENQAPLSYFPNIRAGIDVGRYKPTGDNVLNISREDGSGEFIPEVRQVNGRNVYFVNDYIQEAGFFRLKEDDKTIKELAFNYHRRESDLRCADIAALRAIEKELPGVELLAEGKRELTQLIAERNHGLKLWKWFVLAALLFILIEVLLLRFFKKSSETGV